MTAHSAEPLQESRSPLSGFRVGVTSDRRSSDLISAFERRGADVVHAPALRIAPHEQDDQLVEETRALVAARPEVVLVTTGYGVRRWFEVADAAGLGTDLTAVLDEAHVMARGPKAFGAVRAAGLEHVRTTVHESTAGMVDELEAAGDAYRCLAVQLHGYTDEDELARLAALADSVLTVTPYRWVRPEAGDQLSRLIESACTGQLDVLTFTSAPGAAAVLDAASAIGRYDDLVAALRGDVMAAAVGPVTAGPLLEAGIDPVVPERYRLGALIRLVCDQLASDHVLRLRSNDHVLELRGRALTVGNNQVLLGPTALALFKRLASTDAVVSKRELAACMPDGGDEHALEVAVSRLRRTLGSPELITTVVKRGYRLNARPEPAAKSSGV
ncbi:MAG TPA: uroporphyrinogen-III synthase [Lapillicoccus sp.]|nr:uroporphyrinogen-III synthase [Lapillicoccus sp.]